MNLHTVMVTHNRLELTQQAIESYLSTVDGPFSLIVVDNYSTDGTREWLLEHGADPVRYILLDENKYPGYATNLGWSHAPPDTVLLQRADNDFIFLSGWEIHARLMFSANPLLGQLGLRTDQQEQSTLNVGGNNIIRKTLWDKGLRYDERSWPQVSKQLPGFTEDSFLSPAVIKMGYTWARATQPCIQPISYEDPDDPYYQRSWADRRIGP